MKNERVYQMTFGRIYPLYLQKAVNKGRSKEEVDAVLCWLTGYDLQGLQAQAESGCSLAEFFARAPQINPRAGEIKGVICGVRVEEIDDPLMQQIRRMDKLVDELARGKALEKVLRG